MKTVPVLNCVSLILHLVDTSFSGFHLEYHLLQKCSIRKSTCYLSIIDVVYTMMDDYHSMGYSRTPLIRPPSESHWCGRIRGMVAREGFIYEQKPLSVT